MAAPSLVTLGFSAISWIEHFLVHGPGDVQGQEIELDDEFAGFIVKAYRLNRDGSRKVRRAFLSRAKGRSKSGLAGFIACFEALGPCRFDHFAEAGEVSDWGYEYAEGEPVGRPLTYAEVLCVATEEGQAGNTYDGIYYMLHADTCSPELLATYGRLDVGLTRINLPNKRGFIEPVTSADTSADGGKSTFIVADETHLWILGRLKRLHGIMTRNLLKRKIASGWMLETSTMYAAGEDSVAEGTHAYAKAVAAGSRRDDSLLFDHRQASDGYDLSKRAERIKALHEAYGPAAAWMNLGAIADSYDDPQVSEAEWRRFWLNQPVPLDDLPTAVIPAALWDKLISETPPAQDLPPTAMSVDMSHDRVISVAGAWSNGDECHVELLAVDAVIDPLAAVDWVAERAGRRIEVFIDGASPASAMIPALKARKVKVNTTTAIDMGRACGMFFDDALAGRLHHAGQKQVDLALAGAKKRGIRDAGAWGWDRKDGSVNIAPLVSVTLARFGAAVTKPKKRATGTQRIVMLS